MSERDDGSKNRESAEAYARYLAGMDASMRQKVALCRVLLHDPDILLLDEPTSGLDPEMSRTVRTMLDARRARGCAILLSTHNLDEAERQADRVAVLHTRLLAIDTPAALRRRLATGRVMIRTVENASAWLSLCQRRPRRRSSPTNGRRVMRLAANGTATWVVPSSRSPNDSAIPS